MRVDCSKELALRHEAEQNLLLKQQRGELVWIGSRGKVYTAFYAQALKSHRHPPSGTCKWCGEPVQKPSIHWHPICAEEYKTIHWWSHTVWLLRWGVYPGIKCVVCGTGVTEWDHIRPLHEAGQDVTAHFLNNIQPLCHECHARKTAEQAFRRRKPKAEPTPQRTQQVNIFDDL